MTRLTFFILLLTTVFCRCSEKKQIVSNSATFTSFEISYTNGWGKGFSFIFDSNKIFFSPQHWDTTYYGILPDTIFNLLDTTFLRIRNDDNIKSKDGGCVDCSVLAIKIISGGDTTRINQTGYLDNLFSPVIKSLQRFIDSSEHNKIQAIVLLDTKLIISPRPPKIEKAKIKPLVTTEKSGR